MKLDLTANQQDIRELTTERDKINTSLNTAAAENARALMVLNTEGLRGYVNKFAAIPANVKNIVEKMSGPQTDLDTISQTLSEMSDLPNSKLALENAIKSLKAMQVANPANVYIPKMVKMYETLQKALSGITDETITTLNEQLGEIAKRKEKGATKLNILALDNELSTAQRYGPQNPYNQRGEQRAQASQKIQLETNLKLDEYKQLYLTGKMTKEEFEHVSETLNKLNALKLDNVKHEIKSIGADIGQILGDATEGFFKDWANGTDIFKAFLNQLDAIANKLIDMAFKMLDLGGGLSGILGGGGGGSGGSGGGGGGFGGFLGMIGSLFGGGGGNMGGTTAGGAMYGPAFALGGDTVYSGNAMTEKPYAQALAEEGSGAFMSLMHPGEIVLSDRTGEAQLWRRSKHLLPLLKTSQNIMTNAMGGDSDPFAASMPGSAPMPSPQAIAAITGGRGGDNINIDARMQGGGGGDVDPHRMQRRLRAAVQQVMIEEAGPGGMLRPLLSN